MKAAAAKSPRRSAASAKLGKAKRHAAAAPAPERHLKLARAQGLNAPYQPLAPTPASSLAELHVTHDRKQHLAAEESGPQRKATAEDFLTAAPLNGAEPAVELVLPGMTEQLSGVSHPDSDDERGPRTAPLPKRSPASAQQEKNGSELVALSNVVHKADANTQITKPQNTKLPNKISEPEAIAPVILPALYTRKGRLIVPAAMRGSHEILVHQNVMADQDGLDRIQDDDDLAQLRRAKLLVALPQSAGLRADERLPANRRFARPWTAQFLTALAKAHYQRFHSSLQVNSAVRTVAFQQRLLRTNGNAAPAEGQTASPHLTGQAIDLAKKGLSLAEIAWVRGYLTPLVQAGKVDVEEEFQQSCFHISVYRKYGPQPALRRVATSRRGQAAASAMR